MSEVFQMLSYLLTAELPPLGAENRVLVEHFTFLNTGNDTTNEAETLLTQLSTLNTYLETKKK
jgi:hypothetical protein